MSSTAKLVILIRYRSIVCRQTGIRPNLHWLRLHATSTEGNLEWNPESRGVHPPAKQEFQKQLGFPGGGKRSLSRSCKADYGKKHDYILEWKENIQTLFGAEGRIREEEEKRQRLHTLGLARCIGIPQDNFCCESKPWACRFESLYWEMW